MLNSIRAGASMLGALMLALGLPFFGYALMLVSSIAFIRETYKRRAWSDCAMWVFFSGCNILGLNTYTFKISFF